jgi:hypothetical protein
MQTTEAKYLKFEKEFLHDMVNCPLELKNFYHVVPVAFESTNRTKAEFEIRKAMLLNNPEIQRYLGYLTEKYELKNPEKMDSIRNWIDENIADRETRPWSKRIDEYNEMIGLLLPVRIFIDINFPTRFMLQLDETEKAIIEFLLYEGDINEAKTRFKDVDFGAFEKKLISLTHADNFNQVLYIALVLGYMAKEHDNYLAHWFAYMCSTFLDELQNHKHWKDMKPYAMELLKRKFVVEAYLEDSIAERRLLLNCFMVDKEAAKKMINLDDFCDEFLEFCKSLKLR